MTMIIIVIRCDNIEQFRLTIFEPRQTAQKAKKNAKITQFCSIRLCLSFTLALFNAKFPSKSFANSAI